MALGKIGIYAVNAYRTSLSSSKKGVQYVTHEAKELFANHTKIGRRLREGVQDARISVNVKMPKISDKSDNLMSSVKNKIKTRGFQAVENLWGDNEFMITLKKVCKKRTPFVKAHRPSFIGEDLSLRNIGEPEFYQMIIEAMGVGSTKIAQICSDNPKIIAQIEKKFGSKFVKAMKQTKSSCLPTRTIEEAQEAVSKAFPGQNITVTSQLGTASIGETYIVKKADGSTAVCKMIKKGIDKEQLELEEKLLSRLSKEIADTPEELAQYQGQIKRLYKDWTEELNFVSEKLNNELLAKGAKRYKVAKITDIAEDGSCILMNKANGIKMDKLIEILNDYKTNPAGFAAKYSKAIAENPWLANPEKVINELPTTLLKAFDEQFMFLKKGARSVMHGDPHTGNYFITVTEKDSLIPEFIDTGSCISRTSAQIKDDISFFSNYLVGNSKGIAEYFVKQAKYAGANKKEIVEQVAEELQREIFGKKHNIKKFTDVQSNITAILEKHRIQISPENATALKAQMQFLSTVSQAGKLSGHSLDIFTLMKDIPNASWCLVKTGNNPYGAVKDSLKFAFYNQRQAVGTAYQFVIKEPKKVFD